MTGLFPGMEDDAECGSSRELVENWNDKAPTSCLEWTAKRKKSYNARMRERYFREHWRRALEKLKASDFLQGQNDRGWKATIDWFLKPDSVTRIMEGKYDNRKPKTAQAKVSTAEDFRRD